jgi:uncharacterized protein
MQKTLIITSCLLAGRIFAETEIKGTPAELSNYLSGVPKSVIITGEAEVRSAADKAIVSIKVSSESKTLHDTLRSNQEFRSKLVDFLQKQGIPSDRVKASRFSSTPRFGIFSEKAKSYRVDNFVKVTVQDERELQIAASAIDSSSDVQFLGAEFEHGDKDALKAKVIADACENAEKKRKVFEQKLGLKLGIRKFSVGSVSQRPSAMTGALYERKASSGFASTATPPSYAGRVPTLGDSPALHEEVSAFGELLYTAEVTIEYEVQSK